MKKTFVKNNNSANEKKKWISITGLCNNKCFFCLEEKIKPKINETNERVREEIDKGIKEKADRLVLSGGDPTVHPQLIDFISYGKQKGYKKIQVVTNGRRFAYKDYAEKAVAAGLDEVTFSLHGHTSVLHDTHTCVKGSFEQILAGIKNMLRLDRIVNTDTAITKQNYKFLPEIVSFVHHLGIAEINLMGIVPFGRAWENRNRALYNYAEVMPKVREAVDYCHRHGMHIWFSRIPARYLEGYEGFIYETKKIKDDIQGFEYEFECEDPQKCALCSLGPACDNIYKIVKNKKDELMTELPLHIIDKKNYKKIKLVKGERNYILLNTSDPENMADMQEVVKHFALYSNVQYLNIPICISEDADKYSRQELLFTKDLGWQKAVGKAIDNMSTKIEKCTNCEYKKICRGLPIDYAKEFTFRSIKPCKK